MTVSGRLSTDKKLYQCAIPAWQLCDARGPGFCCEAEWVCFIEDNGTEVGCSSPGAVLSSGQTPAATIYGANAGPSDTVTATATSALSESTTSPITSVAASPTNGQASHASLSSGAKAGIGVGVAVAILVAVVALFFVLRRKRRPSIKPNEHEFSKAELHSESLKKVETHIAELDDTGTINETGTEEKPAEMEDQSKYAELEGEWRGHEAPPVDQKVDDVSLPSRLRTTMTEVNVHATKFYHLDLSRRYPQIQLPPHIDYPFDKV